MDETMAPLLVVLAAGAVLAGSLALAVALSLRRNRSVSATREALAALAVALPGARREAGGAVAVARGGRTVRLQLRGPAKNVPFTLVVDADAGAQAAGDAPGGAADLFAGYRAPRGGALVVENRRPIVLRREAALDRLGKLLRINREAQTGDPEFDARVYVETDADDAVVLRALGEPQARQAVLALFDAGYHAVTLYDEARAVSVAHLAPTTDLLRPGYVARALDALDALASRLPPLQVRGPARSPAITPRDAFIAGGIAAAILLGIATAAVSDVWQPVDAGPYRAGCQAGAALWLVALPLVIAKVRGRSSSFRALLGIALVLAFDLPLLGVVGTVAVNAVADSSPAAEHVLPVFRVWSTGSRSRTYHARVASWHEGDPEPVDLEVSRGVADELLRSGGRARVVTREGALGYEWVEAVEPANAAGWAPR